VDNKIAHRIYVSGILTTQGPVLVGNGVDENSDCDFVRDSSGLPILPGSSLAGAFRAALRDAGVHDDDKDDIFGTCDSDELRQSPLTLYDATLAHTGSPDEALQMLRMRNQLRIRDSVRLEDNGRTVKDNGKFDFEVVESGVEFTFRCELVGWSSNERTWSDRRYLLERLIDMLQTDGIGVGAKTTRGLGVVKLAETRWLELDMKHPDDVQTWVNFDWDTTVQNNGLTLQPAKNSCAANAWKFNVDFRLMGPLLIRSYTANPDEPDYVQFKAADKTTIPGTSWAGVLRHAVLSTVTQLAELVPISERRDKAAALLTGKLFGPCLDPDKTDARSTAKPKAQRSALIVHESVVTGSEDMDYTRNRIDRFTGGVVDSALFTERPAVPALAMKTTLSLSLACFPQNQKMLFEAMIGALYLVLCDMAHGMLPIGGESSVGRGILAADTVEIIPPGSKAEHWTLDGAAGQARPYLTSLHAWLLQKEVL